MSRSFYRLCLLIILTASGCAWQPETIVPTQPNGPPTGIQVVIDSSRWLDGTEHGERHVFPGDVDSVQFIIVNGQIVWANSASYYEDSLSPYHIDETENTVTVVWPSVSRTDTESFLDTAFHFLSPSVGDTIVRANGVTVTIPKAVAKFNPEVAITDGVETFAFFNDSTGIVTFSDTTLMKLHGPMAQISLDVNFTSFDPFPSNLYSTSIESYRSIQYPMK